MRCVITGFLITTSPVIQEGGIENRFQAQSNVFDRRPRSISEWQLLLRQRSCCSRRGGKMEEKNILFLFVFRIRPQEGRANTHKRDWYKKEKKRFEKELKKSTAKAWREDAEKRLQNLTYYFTFSLSGSLLLAGLVRKWRETHKSAQAPK